MFNQILVALKFGSASIYALKKALDLAQANDANLHIFHALDYTYQNADENDPELAEVRRI
ncbi:MAG: universal stress protein, partial [bacterium]|nr:universal stress protein [bacterium]